MDDQDDRRLDEHAHDVQDHAAIIRTGPRELRLTCGAESHRRFIAFDHRPCVCAPDAMPPGALRPLQVVRKLPNQSHRVTLLCQTQSTGEFRLREAIAVGAYKGYLLDPSEFPSWLP